MERDSLQNKHWVTRFSCLEYKPGRYLEKVLNFVFFCKTDAKRAAILAAKTLADWNPIQPFPSLCGFTLFS